jgi:hypothetical protein
MLNEGKLNVDENGICNNPVSLQSLDEIYSFWMCITNDQKLSKFLKRTKIFSNDLNLFHRGIF